MPRVGPVAHVVIMSVVKQNDHNRRATGRHNDTTRLLGLTGLAVVRIDDARRTGRWCT